MSHPTSPRPYTQTRSENHNIDFTHVLNEFNICFGRCACSSVILRFTRRNTIFISLVNEAYALSPDDHIIQAECSWETFLPIFHKFALALREAAAAESKQEEHNGKA